MQPHANASGSQYWVTQAPSTQTCPQPQAGEHGRAVHWPAVHFDPLAQPQVPPQPSLPPQLPSVGHCGLQQAPLYKVVPLPHGHVRPHPSDIPPLLPSAGHAGAQHWPM